jgi:hypothetical protein
VEICKRVNAPPDSSDALMQAPLLKEQNNLRTFLLLQIIHSLQLLETTFSTSINKMKGSHIDNSYARNAISPARRSDPISQDTIKERLGTSRKFENTSLVAVVIVAKSST